MSLLIKIYATKQTTTDFRPSPVKSLAVSIRHPSEKPGSTARRRKLSLGKTTHEGGRRSCQPKTHRWADTAGQPASELEVGCINIRGK